MDTQGYSIHYDSLKLVRLSNLFKYIESYKWN